MKENNINQINKYNYIKRKKIISKGGKDFIFKNNHKAKAITHIKHLDLMVTLMKRFILYNEKLLFNLFILINLTVFIKSEEYSISLIIKGKGMADLMHKCSSNEYCHGLQNIKVPDKIYINGQIKTLSTYYKYNFVEDDNNVTLIWYTALNNLNYIFYDCDKIYKIDFSNFDSSQVTAMSSVFDYCTSLVSINFTNFNTSKVTTMFQMFRLCKSLVSLNVSNFDTSNVENMHLMFYGCLQLKSLDLLTFNTSNVNTMYFMFSDCSSLKYLNLSNFDVSQVTIMRGMFSGCISLISIEMFNYKTSNLQDIYYMFNNCSSLISINLSNFETSKITDLNKMFYGCSSLKSLDLSNFVTESVYNMDYMFYGCSSLISLNISNFNFSNIYKIKNMFYNCFSLKNLYLSTFKESMFTEPFSIISSKINVYTKYETDFDIYLSSCSNFICCSNDDIPNNYSNLKCYKNCSDYRLNSDILNMLCGENSTIIYNLSFFDFSTIISFESEKIKSDSYLNISYNNDIDKSEEINYANISELILDKIEYLINTFNESEYLVKKIKREYFEKNNVLITFTQLI